LKSFKKRVKRTKEFYEEARLKTQEIYSLYKKKSSSEFKNKTESYKKLKTSYEMENIDLKSRLKNVRMLIDMVGPQNLYVEKARECNPIKFRISNRDKHKQMCCDQKYLFTINGKVKLPKEYCALRSLIQK